MAKIVDPDSLNQATEVVIVEGAKTFQLLVAGNLDDTAPGKTSGVTGQAVYSFAKEEWKDDVDLNKVRFPMDPIFDQQFKWANGWAPADQQTRDLLRDGGWQETDGKEDACILTLGAMDAPGSDQAYFQNITGFDQTTTDFDKTGELNELIEIIGSGGSPDRSDFLKVFLREQGKTYAQSNLLVDQDLAALTYIAYRIPLSNGTDINVTESDANIDTQAPYTSMTLDFLRGHTFDTWATGVKTAEHVVQDTAGRWWFTDLGGTSAGNDTDLGGGSDTGVTWEAFAGEVQIGANWYAFNRIIDGAAATKGEIYNWSVRQGRQTIDINDDGLGNPNQDAYGTVNGNVAVELVEFVGTTLKSKPGVAITNFDVNDTNAITMFDITVDGGGLDSEDVPIVTTERSFPFVAAGNLLFSANLVNETNADTLYRMYYEYTTRWTATDVDVGSVTGPAATLTSAATIDFTNILNNDYFIVAGFLTNAVNNGVKQATGNGTATNIPYTDSLGRTQIVEAAGDSVTVDENPFDTPSAIVVDDDGGSDITGQVNLASIVFDYDYDNNVQGGRTQSTDAAVIVVAQGLNDSKWVEGSFTITQATGLSFPVNAADELVYSNP